MVGELDHPSLPAIQDKLLRRAGRGPGSLWFDLSGVTRVDTAGVAFFGVLETHCRRRKADLHITSFSEPARAAFELLRLVDPEDDAGRAPGALERLGSWGYSARRGALDFLMLVADTFVWSLGGARRTARVQRGATWSEAVALGLNALPIVGLIAMLIGLVLALQSAYQLRQFGGTIYMANLIAVSMTREMGPLITAIIVAGRSGASIAAEVASMRVSEELDALRTMGLSPIRYVIVPKFRAMTLCLPALTVYANVIGIVGGFVVALLYLGLGPDIYFRQVWRALVTLDVVTGLLKSVVFGWIIVLLGAYRGSTAYGGAEAVGRVTTQAVVDSIFWVIVADAIFSILFYFGD